VTWARSRGGKGRLAAPARLIFEVEASLCPALTPEANRVGVKADLGAGGDVGDVGLLVHEDDQVRPLTQVSRCGATAGEQPRLDEELDGETGLVEGGGAGQGTCPPQTGCESPMNRFPSP
jgi:hypothetical protein